jgi:DNA-binding response OmpR family regulator
VQKAFSCGAKDYLVTPYDPAVLERKVEALLSRTLVKR